MNVIIKANEEMFKEESDVCEAIIYLFRDEYDKGIEDAIENKLISLVQKGLLTVEVAANELNISVDDFKEKMKMCI